VPVALANFATIGAVVLPLQGRIVTLRPVPSININLGPLASNQVCSYAASNPCLRWGTGA
jgi:hypothetical protein